MRILNGLPLGSFDLHMHSTASDGTYSPAALVKKAKQVRLKTIALTDHDTLSGVNEAQEAGKQYGIGVIPGVEISTTFNGKSVDILGYNIVRRDELHDKLVELRDYRHKRALKIIEKFAELNMPITLEDVKQFSRDSVIARPHIAKAIVQKGYVANVQQVFTDYLADGKPAEVPKKHLTTEAAITMIRQSGGVAVLAHPVLLGGDEHVQAILEIGFDGIEVWHRQHSPFDAEKYIHYAAQYGLVVTGGSDFHGDEHCLGRFIP